MEEFRCFPVNSPPNYNYVVNGQLSYFIFVGEREVYKQNWKGNVRENVIYVPLKGVALIQCPLEGDVVWMYNGQFLHHRIIIMTRGFIVVADIRMDTVGLYRCYKVSPNGLVLLASVELVLQTSKHSWAVIKFFLT